MRYFFVALFTAVCLVLIRDRFEIPANKPFFPSRFFVVTQAAGLITGEGEDGERGAKVSEVGRITGRFVARCAGGGGGE